MFPSLLNIHKIVPHTFGHISAAHKLEGRKTTVSTYSNLCLVLDQLALAVLWPELQSSSVCLRKCLLRGPPSKYLCIVGPCNLLQIAAIVLWLIMVLALFFCSGNPLARASSMFQFLVSFFCGLKAQFVLLFWPTAQFAVTAAGPAHRHTSSSLTRQGNLKQMPHQIAFGFGATSFYCRSRI